LRIGPVGQRTRIVDTARALQRGLFAQTVIGAATRSLYAFNLDSSADRYVVFACDVQVQRDV
jgi:hypothetical protein